jgi:hypothetical protein
VNSSALPISRSVKTPSVNTPADGYSPHRLKDDMKAFEKKLLELNELIYFTGEEDPSENADIDAINHYQKLLVNLNDPKDQAFLKAAEERSLEKAGVKSPIEDKAAKVQKILDLTSLKNGSLESFKALLEKEAPETLDEMFLSFSKIVSKDNSKKESIKPIATNIGAHEPVDVKIKTAPDGSQKISSKYEIHNDSWPNNQKDKKVPDYSHYYNNLKVAQRKPGDKVSPVFRRVPTDPDCKNTSSLVDENAKFKLISLPTECDSKNEEYAYAFALVESIKATAKMKAARAKLLEKYRASGLDVSDL